MPKLKTEVYQPFLNAAYVVSNLVSEIIILNEGKEVEKNFDNKKSKALELQVQVDAKDKPIKDWTLNGTSHATLIKCFGDETKNWIGKRVCITVAKTSLGKDAINVDEVRTKLANQAPVATS